MIKRDIWFYIATVLWIVGGLRTGTSRADDVQVNTYTTGNQLAPSVASDADGDAVVVWFGAGSGTSDFGIYGQRYATDGSPVASEFLVNAYTTGSQFRPSVAMDADGDFVIVWDSSLPGSQNSQSIQGQRFAADGSPAGGQFQINTYTMSDQFRPSVAMDADGDFVVAWTGFGSVGTDTSGRSVQGRLYAADGSPVGGQFQVNTYTTDVQDSPSVAMDAGGNFVIVWSGLGSGTDSSVSVQGQRYAADGSPDGDEFQVNTYTTGGLVGGGVAMDTNGDFVVVWSALGGGTDPTIDSVQGQRFAADGSPEGGEFQVNTYTPEAQVLPSVAMDANGDFVVIWISSGSATTDTSGTSVQGQRYTADGSPEGKEFQVNTYTTGSQVSTSVSTDAAGTFLVVWQSSDSSGTDTSYSSIQKTGDPLTVGPPLLIAIPTLSAWNLLLLAGLLALLAAQRLRGTRSQVGAG